MAVGFISPDNGYAFDALGSGGPQKAERAEFAGTASGQPALDSYVTLHSDGTSWSQVATKGNEFGALSASSPTDALMVRRAADGRTITQHWDGSTWTVVPSPSRGTDNDCLGRRPILGHPREVFLHPPADPALGRHGLEPL